jgi:hypothetical protein
MLLLVNDEGSHRVRVVQEFLGLRRHSRAAEMQTSLSTRMSSSARGASREVCYSLAFDGNVGLLPIHPGPAVVGSSDVGIPVTQIGPTDETTRPSRR